MCCGDIFQLNVNCQQDVAVDVIGQSPRQFSSPHNPRISAADRSCTYSVQYTVYMCMCMYMIVQCTCMLTQTLLKGIHVSAGSELDCWQDQIMTRM